MFQYPWILAEAMHPIIGEDGEMATGGKEGDPLLEEMYLLQGMEALQDASTAGRKGIMHEIAPKRSSYPAMKETTGKPTSSTYKKKRSKTNAMTIKCMTSKKLIQWQLSVCN